MAVWQKKPKCNDPLCNYIVKNPQTHYVAEIVQNTHESIKPEIKKKINYRLQANRLKSSTILLFPMNLLNGTDYLLVG